MPLALRAWLRYVVPLTALAVIALAPLGYFALHAPKPVDVLHARAELRTIWMLAAMAICLQVWLVAAAAPSVRSLAAGAPLSQVRSLLHGVRSLVRAFVPWLVAMFAVLLGGVALVVPGLVLLVLVSLTGASDVLGSALPGPIDDSVAVARRMLPRLAVVVIAIVAFDLAITYATQMMFVPAVGKKVAVAKLAPIQTFARTMALAIVGLSPLAACALAAVYSHAKRR